MTQNTTKLILFITIYILLQLVLGWQIAKQLSCPNLFHKALIKVTDQRKVEFFLCNKRKTAVKPTIHQNSVVSKALLGKF